MCIFAGAWMVFAPHPWALWSILGSALILFTSYFQVQVSVAINSWINGVSVDEYVFPYWPSGPPRTGTQQVASTGKAPNSLRARWSSESRRSVHS